MIENLGSIIWDVDRQNKTICLNLDGERQEGAASSLTLSEADERPDVGIGNEAEFEPIR